METRSEDREATGAAASAPPVGLEVVAVMASPGWKLMQSTVSGQVWPELSWDQPEVTIQVRGTRAEMEQSFYGLFALRGYRNKVTVWDVWATDENVQALRDLGLMTVALEEALESMGTKRLDDVTQCCVTWLEER